MTRPHLRKRRAAHPRCPACRQSFDLEQSCTVDIGAHPFTAETFADEMHLIDVDDIVCRDCRTPRHGLHHPRCCVAQCRICGDQRMACECPEP